MKSRDYLTTFMIRKDLKTKKLAHDCRRMIGRDMFGRKIPIYLVVHRALVELKASLKEDWTQT